MRFLFLANSTAEEDITNSLIYHPSRPAENRNDTPHSSGVMAWREDPSAEEWESRMMDIAIDLRAKLGANYQMEATFSGATSLAIARFPASVRLNCYLSRVQNQRRSHHAGEVFSAACSASCSPPSEAKSESQQSSSLESKTDAGVPRSIGSVISKLALVETKSATSLSSGIEFDQYHPIRLCGYEKTGYLLSTVDVSPVRMQFPSILRWKNREEASWRLSATMETSDARRHSYIVYENRG